MKRLLPILLLLFPFIVEAQTPSFLGIPFGSSFQDVEAALDVRFSYASKYVPNDRSILEYGNSYVNIGDIYKFPSLFIHFRSVVGKNIMYAAELGGQLQKQSSELVAKRDQLKAYYAKKYPYTSYYLPEGGKFKFVKFGYDSNNIVGEIQIMVWMDGTIIKGYNLRIHYSPTSMELMCLVLK